MPNFIYRIDPIVPVTRGPFRMCPVGADLDYDFAVKARSTEMSEEIRNKFVEIGNDITNKFFDTKKIGRETSYHFVKESWLLQYCTVPGNACDFGLEHNAQHDFLEDFERTKQQQNLLRDFPISYTPHNVDTINQATCLLSLWLEWANLTKSFLIDSPQNL